MYHRVGRVSARGRANGTVRDRNTRTGGIGGFIFYSTSSFYFYFRFSFPCRCCCSSTIVENNIITFSSRSGYEFIEWENWGGDGRTYTRVQYINNNNLSRYIMCVIIARRTDFSTIFFFLYNIVFLQANKRNTRIWDNGIYKLRCNTTKGFIV